MEKGNFNINIQEIQNMSREKVTIYTHPDNAEVLASILYRLHKEIHGDENE